MEIYEMFSLPMIAVFFPMIWLANIGVARRVGYWQYKKHMLKLNRFWSVCLFLCFRKSRFSWWVVIQQCVLYVLTVILFLSFIFDFSISLELFRFYVFKGYWILYFPFILDSLFFDNSDKFVK